MSILQQIASPNLKYCCIHPQERVVGVCGACLAHKLSSLIRTAAPSPLPQHVVSLSQLVGSSRSPPIPLTSAPPHHPPLPHHQDHLLLTINEEPDSSTQEILSNEGLPCSDLEELPSVVDACAVATMHTGNDLAHLTLTHQETSSICGDVPSINEEKPVVVDQEISLIGEVRPTINEEIPIINGEKPAVEEGISTTSQQIHGKKSAKCRRSKSLSVLRRESLNDTLRAGHGHDLAAKSLVERTGEHRLGVNKVTLRTLFEIENDEKCRDRELAAMATQAVDIQLGARDDQFPENSRPIEKLHDNSIGDSQKTEEVVKDVRDKNEHNSHGCVPSASTFSTSVCPSVPDKLKSSVCLNSLLCRKARDKGSVIKGSGAFRRRPSQVHEANRHNICIKKFDEEGSAGASHRDEGGLVRATYIPSEPRVIRTGRRKLERCIANTSASCSPTSSPASISQAFDSKSERKFNLSARALAVDVPSAILRSSAEASDTSKIAGSLPINDGQASMSTDSDTVEFTAEARPVIPLVLTAEEEQRLAESIASVARKAKGPEAIGNLKILRNQKQQVNEEEHGEMTDSPPPPTPDISVEMPAHNLPTILQPLAAADMMLLTIPSNLTIDLEEAHEHDALAGTVQGEDAEGRNTVRNRLIPECRNATDNQPECEDTTENRQILESLDATDNQPVPSYITATESFQLEGQEAKAVYGRSLSCKASSGTEGKQSSHNLAEGVWEPYSSKSGKTAGLFGRSSSRHHKWPSSSRTVKIAPDQSGLLRFYLTPLRASGRTRFLSPRRPPKRQLWSFLSQGAH